jgi:hypothetical protein
MTWKGQPLVNYETVVHLIGATRTRSGLVEGFMGNLRGVRYLDLPRGRLPRALGRFHSVAEERRSAQAFQDLLVWLESAPIYRTICGGATLSIQAGVCAQFRIYSGLNAANGFIEGCYG